MRRRFLLPLLPLLLGVLALAGCGGSSSSSTSAPAAPAGSASAPAAAPGAIGFEGVELESGPEIAPASTTQTGIIDGIKCGSTEQLAYHIHAHLTLFVNGRLRALPAGIGIPGSQAQATAQGPVAAGGLCIYWLHTHAPDGVIHVESPTARIYTLGNFFDEWHQPLNVDGVGTATGKVTAFFNGKPWKQDPRSIPLTPHAVIQLSVGSPVVPFIALSWSPTQL